MSEARPEDVLGYQPKGDNQNKNIVTKSSVKVDENVKTIEDKVINSQNLINYWRIKITKNEKTITFFCVMIGILFSWAINRCTGNLNIPSSVYVLSAIIILVIALLLIAEEALALIVLVRFAVAMFLGHYFMMWLVAIDGRYFSWFASEVCRYPVSVDVTAGIVAGIFIGYIAKSFEEIRAARGG